VLIVSDLKNWLEHHFAAEPSPALAAP